MINFFGYFKKTNHIGIWSVDFERAVMFLKNQDFKIKQLYGFRGKEEVSLLRENEEPSWVTKKHYIEISWLLSENDNTPFSYVEIELSNGGKINFSTGQLFVKFPKEKDLKQDTLKLLETMGYYASNAIFNFCESNPGMHLLEFVLGMKEEDITDEFEKIKAHSERIEKELL
tara:strand:- start:1586 stop:2101 length:516 start_codon:yes stop_codon:yes gene_type:complete